MMDDLLFFRCSYFRGERSVPKMSRWLRCAYVTECPSMVWQNYPVMSGIPGIKVQTLHAANQDNG